MKVQIRRNVFETNSSSVHSMTMCSGDEYKKWKDGELLFDCWNEDFVDANDPKVKEAREKYEKEFKEWENNSIANCWGKPDCEYLTCDEFRENYNYEYETFERNYTTKSGETVVAFGYYGHD